jgi:hypothetical protein
MSFQSIPRLLHKIGLYCRIVSLLHTSQGLHGGAKSPRLSMIRIDSDSNTGGDTEFVAGHHECFGHSFDSLVRDQSSIAGSFDLGKQYDKFISSVSANRVLVAQGIAQTLGYSL